MYVNVEHCNWDDFLQPSISSYNTSVHASLKLSPIETLFSKAPIILAEVMLSLPTDETTNETDISSFFKHLKKNANEINLKFCSL